METEAMSCWDSESLLLSLAEIKSEEISEIDSGSKTLGSSLSETKSDVMMETESMPCWDSDSL